MFFRDYLENRQQTVTVESFQSSLLHTGPMSVCQGSTLSGLLYLIYTLDYPLIHSEKKINIKEYDETNEPKTTTFMDDSIVKIKLDKDKKKHNEQIEKVLDKVTDYMNANSLVINKDKTKVLVIMKDNNIRENIKIKVEGKEDIKPVRSMVYLGIQIKDDMRWNHFIEDRPDNLIKRLKNKISAIKLIRKYLSEKTTKMILDGIFMATLLYGACLWVGTPNYLKKKVQSLQLEAARTAIGIRAQRWSTKKLLNTMNWLPIQKILERETAITTHRIINTMNPEHLSYKMIQKYKIGGQGPKETRTTGQGKLGSRPKEIGKSKVMKYHFRVSAYSVYSKLSEELTNMKDPIYFKRWINRYFLNPKNLPSLMRKKKKVPGK